MQGARSTSSNAQDLANAGKPRGRLIELDVLRGFLLVWMALTHLPTKASLVSNQTFGFVSGAEGFIFLAGFMMGQLEQRLEGRAGEDATIRDAAKRTFRVYLYHCALLAIAFTLVAEIGVSLHRLNLQNLLSFYLQKPKQAIIAAALLEYRPSLLDILPMYVVFLILTPLARLIARHWGWRTVIGISFAFWIAAQFGLRHWLHQQGDFFGLSVPENSTGAFDLYAWQLLWMVGLALGTNYAQKLASAAPSDTSGGKTPEWLLKTALIIASIFLILRYSPVDHWMNPDLYGKLIDKWHLGPIRLVNFSALAIVLMRFGTRIARLPFLMPLASLGQASIEVFSVHVLCCIGGVALSREADPNLPWWQQVFLVVFTLGAMFGTAHLARRSVVRKLSAPKLAHVVGAEGTERRRGT